MPSEGASLQDVPWEGIFPPLFRDGLPSSLRQDVFSWFGNWFRIFKWFARQGFFIIKPREHVLENR